MTWFAIQTHPLREILVSNDLWVSGYETLCLRYWITIRPQNRPKTVLRALYPRYIFAELDADGIHLANSTRGVQSIVRAGSQYLAIPPEIIAQERLRGSPDGLVDAPPVHLREKLQRGSTVKISGLEALQAVVTIDNGATVGLKTFLFGRELPVTVAPEAIAG